MTTPLYRVTITFTDGVFTVDVATFSVATALDLAMTDARMGHPSGTYSGAVLSYKAEPVCELRVDAHCMDDEIEALFLKEYGVKVTDREGAPWDWGFQGTREQLLRMYADHWGDSPERDDLDIKEVRR